MVKRNVGHHRRPTEIDQNARITFLIMATVAVIIIGGLLLS